MSRRGLSVGDVEAAALGAQQQQDQHHAPRNIQVGAPTDDTKNR